MSMYGHVCPKCGNPITNPYDTGTLGFCGKCSGKINQENQKKEDEFLLYCPQCNKLKFRCTCPIK